MKKKEILVVCSLLLLGLLFGLTGCQKEEKTYGQECWSEARKEKSLEEYAKLYALQLDREALEKEAESEEVPPARLFQLVALLGAEEYQRQWPGGIAPEWREGMFQADFPETEVYADRLLAQIDTAGETFWEAFGEAFYPYDCFWPVFAAAGELSGERLLKLLQEVPGDSSFKRQWEDTIERWLKGDPARMAVVGDALLGIGYFDDWSATDFRGTFYNSSLSPYQIRTETIDEAVMYAEYVRDTLHPLQEAMPGGSSCRKESPWMDTPFYATDLMITLGETVSLQEEAQEGQPEVVETEGKKILALYRNVQTEEFKDSPPALRLMGDFLMSLSEEERPGTQEETDYYLVLTPHYEYGSYYQTAAGNDSAIQQVYSSTAVALYDAKTGVLLRRLGNVMEEPADSIVAGYGEQGLRYPEIVTADTLIYMYRHVNEPDAYAGLVDQTAGRSELAAGESIILGGWEITFRSAETIPAVEDDLRRYEPKNGNVYLQAFFTITNRTPERESFMPLVNYDGKAPIIYLLDAAGEEVYVSEEILTYSNCLNNKGVDPETSEDGELFFQLSEDVAQNREDLYIVIVLGNQMVYYTLE